MFTAGQARAVIRKAKKRVPEGEEVRHLNIMPMMDMMTILLVAFVFQASVSASGLTAGSVTLPRSMSDEPLPENAATLIVTPSGLLLEGTEIVTVTDGAVDASAKEGGASGYKINVLTKELAAVKAEEEQKARAAGKEPPKVPELLIIADRTIPFRLLFDIIFSAKDKEAGFKRFRLIVQRHEPV
jgi:biopolymer transport protein ExbD